MNAQELEATREGLTRELEHHIEELCDIITKDIEYIKNSSNVTVENFEIMTHVGEAVEEICSSIGHITSFLIKAKVVMAAIKTNTKISIDNT